jgi:tight adherence protein C
MEIAIISVLFLAFLTAAFAFTAASFSPASPLRSRLETLIGGTVKPRKTPVRTRVVTALAPIGNMMPKSPTDVSTAGQLLMRAGFREEWQRTVYFALAPMLTIGTIIGIIATKFFVRSLLFSVVLVIVAYVIPGLVLKIMVRRRQLAIRLGLPDALDLTVICVEAGLGLDQSLQRVGLEARVAHPDLSDEFQLVNLELRAGKPRPEALRNLALRTGVEEVRALVAVLIQTDRFGTDVAQALRVHSDALRTSRRQRAEEEAAKTTIKMVPPLVLCILPALFLVVLGPPIILAIRAVGPVIHP